MSEERCVREGCRNRICAVLERTGPVCVLHLRDVLAESCGPEEADAIAEGVIDAMEDDE